jgi:hypothetical protein
MPALSYHREHVLRKSTQRPPIPPYFDGARHEKSVDQKEPVPQHVAEWGKCGGRLSEGACDGSSETQHDRILDCRPDATQAGEEEESATLTRAYRTVTRRRLRRPHLFSGYRPV